MTVSHAVATLRAHGLRVSAARRLVLEALFAADAPVTAETIAGGLGGRLPASDLASVYRNLDTLEAVGVVRHFHVGHGAARYEVAGATGSGLLACERCGAVEHARLDRVRALVEADFGFAARFTHFPLVGVCAACRVD
jgi:Fur family ferric uptake transcriptional regulator